MAIAAMQLIAAIRQKAKILFIIPIFRYYVITTLRYYDITEATAQ